MNIIRKNFPFFNQKKNITFLDSAASTQKPKRVIDKLLEFYSYNYANIHRGMYDLSIGATHEYESVRLKIAQFINAHSGKEIIFTKNTTEAINIIAESFGIKYVNAEEEIMVSFMEHHSNIIPWQQLCKKKGAKLTIISITPDGNLDINNFQNTISFDTKIIAITQMSNVFGSIIDVRQLIGIAKYYGVRVLVDACQSIVHTKVDVTNLDCDFLVFSSHKLYGPTGVGILYGKYEILDYMDVYQTGGAMIDNVLFKKTSFLNPPQKFESGTSSFAEVIAFGEAIEYLRSINLHYCWQREREIINYIKTEINKIDNFHFLRASQESSILCITHKKIHHSDIVQILSKYSIAIRAGHHCCKPLMDFLKITGIMRISLGLYNDYTDAKYLIDSLKKINLIFN